MKKWSLYEVGNRMYDLYCDGKRYMPACAFKQALESMLVELSPGDTFTEYEYRSGEWENMGQTMGWEVLNLYGNRKLQSLLQNRLQWELHNAGKDKNGNPLYDLYVNGRIVDRRLDHNAAMYRLQKANIRGQDSYTEVGGGSISGARLLLQWEIDRLYDAGMSEYLLNDYLNEPIKKPAAWVLWQTVSGMVAKPKYDLLKDGVVIKKDVGYLEATRVVFKNIRPEDTYREYLYHGGERKEFLVLSGADVRRYWSFENSPYFVD